MITAAFIYLFSLRNRPALRGSPAAGRRAAGFPQVAGFPRILRFEQYRYRRAPMKNPRLFSVWVVFFVLSAAIASAQVDTGAILGTVRDPSGAVLPGATVT